LCSKIWVHAFAEKIFNSDVQFLLIEGLEMNDEVSNPFYAYDFKAVNAG
jgi:hypothetical protein